LQEKAAGQVILFGKDSSHQSRFVAFLFRSIWKVFTILNFLHQAALGKPYPSFLYL